MKPWLMGLSRVIKDNVMVAEMISIRRVVEAILNPRVTYTWLLRKRQVAKLLNVPINTVSEYYLELKTKTQLHSAIRMAPHVGKDVEIDGLKMAPLYVIVRILKPDIVIETGVASGVSSCFILEALRENRKGILYSIDYPDPAVGDLIPHGKKSGWVVPQQLRARWELIIGKSKNVLPKLLEKIKTIDIFLHDSEHTYENMMFEYTAVWRKLGSRSILVTDDWKLNTAFKDFCHSFQKRPIEIGYLAGVRKD